MHLTGLKMQREHFFALKQAMSKSPVLSYQILIKFFLIETDASNVVVGAVLMQENHPIAFFFSKKLS